MQKPVILIPVAAPPVEQRARRSAEFAPSPEQRNRYSLPVKLESGSPVGFRVRVGLTPEEGEQAAALLSLDRPNTFVPPETPVTEAELFEEYSLGVLSSRQSTNFRGFRQITVGGEDAKRVGELVHGMASADAALADAEYAHIVLTRPYRTPFTMLLTFIGHERRKNFPSVLKRAYRKALYHKDDIPTIGYLKELHIGILADAMERAAVIASAGRRMANVVQAPFLGEARDANTEAIAELERIAGLGARDRARGWRIGLVTQVGTVAKAERVPLDADVARKIGANLLALRSERIQPGVNAEDKAPPQYLKRQDMDVPDALTEQAGRAAYNAFSHWTGADRERCKDLLLLERVDVLTPGGQERLRALRTHLGEVTDQIVGNLPKWADLSFGKALSRNAMRGKKAFALAGQRIDIGGLDRRAVAQERIPWNLAVRAFGAAASRSALTAELSGLVGLPSDCDLLSGTCVMAGPVNQNDIGKSFYGSRDLLADAFPDHDHLTSLLVWTLKAKTVADPVGNEEQLMNASQKGALVDLRPAPHEVVSVRQGDTLVPFRGAGNKERAFYDVGNFVTDPRGVHIPGNEGEPWPETLRTAAVFS